MRIDFLRIILKLGDFCYIVITLTDEVINGAAKELAVGNTISGIRVIYEYLKAGGMSNNCLAAAHKFVVTCGSSPVVMRRVVKKLRSLR